jgi:glycosyltransferase involved in cell wall biosynthesis
LIKIAFWFDRPAQYSGGLNYLRNLLYSLSRLPQSQIKPFIFFGKSVDQALVEPFEPLATVVRTAVLDRGSMAWFAHQICHRIFGSLFMIGRTIKTYDISIVSHAAAVYARRRSFRVIAWIPDFQYLHLPELFPHSVEEGTRAMLKLIRGSDALILSSFAALADFQKLCPGRPVSSVLVLPFVSQPSVSREQSTADDILKKYEITGRYFFLPNQFWKHKNHAVVFTAVKALKARGIDVVVICSGNLRDYRFRDSSYVDNLIGFIEQNHLADNIRILGQIDYADVLYLMRNCISVINPSRFEGWSSTVEEARSMGQRAILSNIDTHREQNPRGAEFFEADDADGLANIMAEQWSSGVNGVTEEQSRLAAAELLERTDAYGAAYEHFVRALSNGLLERRLYNSARELPTIPPT